MKFSITLNHFSLLFCYFTLSLSFFLYFKIYFSQTVLERHGGDGPGRYSSELRPDRPERTGATNVPGNVGDPNDLANRCAGAHNVCHSICDYLRDSRHTSLGRHRDGQSGILETRGGSTIILDPVAGTATDNRDRYIISSFNVSPHIICRA